MKKSWFTETEVFLLHEIVGRLDRIARTRVLESRGISYPEFLVAMAVRELESPSHGEVGKLLDMSKSLVSQRVSSLMTKGVVLQNRNNDNRRQVQLELTASGRKILEQVYRELAEQASGLFDLLGTGRPRFRQALQLLRDALAAEEAREQ